MYAFDEEEPDEYTTRTYDQLLQLIQDEESCRTATTIEQVKVEQSILDLYPSKGEPLLNRHKHISFIKRALTHLSRDYESLDCSRPWLCYWLLHSLHILGGRLEDTEYSSVINFLFKCQSPLGGFGGGPGQHPHLAATYAAVNALCTIGTSEAYEIINRKTLRSFLVSMRMEDGSFTMHATGEVDVRGVYCAITVAKLTNIYTSEMFQRSEEWIQKCQTWEGGFGGCPGMEAHGGYSFCGLASLMLLEKTNFCHIPSLLRWLVNKQMRLEGGFQGRTNKLVDSCYSYWQGGSFPLIHTILSESGELVDFNNWLFDQEALQEYLLIYCQNPSGGLVDKPHKNCDTYHTCYALSGLSMAQHSPKPVVIGSPNLNLVHPTHPLHNMVLSSVMDALRYFNALPIPEET